MVRQKKVRGVKTSGLSRTTRRRKRTILRRRLGHAEDLPEILPDREVHLETMAAAEALLSLKQSSCQFEDKNLTLKEATPEKIEVPLHSFLSPPQSQSQSANVEHRTPTPGQSNKYVKKFASWRNTNVSPITSNINSNRTDRSLSTSTSKPSSFRRRTLAPSVRQHIRQRRPDGAKGGSSLQSA